MAASDAADDSLYPIAVLIDELKNEDIQVNWFFTRTHLPTRFRHLNLVTLCHFCGEVIHRKVTASLLVMRHIKHKSQSIDYLTIIAAASQLN
jgi:hypothetical protein